MTNWLSTTQAAAALGIAPCTLKRKRDVDGGFLESQTHYRFKTDAANSAIIWDVDTIRDLFHQHALKARKGRKESVAAKAAVVLKELQEGT